MAKEYIIGQEYLDSQNQKKTAYFKDAEAVSTTEVQELTDTQKAQALANIGISGIDDEPTAGSNKLVKSGGVYSSLKNNPRFTLFTKEGLAKYPTVASAENIVCGIFLENEDGTPIDYEVDVDGITYYLSILSIRQGDPNTNKKRAVSIGYHPDNKSTNMYRTYIFGNTETNTYKGVEHLKVENVNGFKTIEMWIDWDKYDTQLENQSNQYSLYRYGKDCAITSYRYKRDYTPQQELIIDNTPIEGSTNAVSSGGMYNKITPIEDALTFNEAEEEIAIALEQGKYKASTGAKRNDTNWCRTNPLDVDTIKLKSVTCDDAYFIVIYGNNEGINNPIVAVQGAHVNTFDFSEFPYKYAYVIIGKDNGETLDVSELDGKVVFTHLVSSGYKKCAIQKGLNVNPIIVDINGNGDYTSLQDAIDNAGDTADSPKTIIVLPGTYVMSTGNKENRSLCGNRHLSIIGTDKNNCILRNDRGFYITGENYEDDACLRLAGNIYIANLTIISTDANYPSDKVANRHMAYCIHADFSASDGDVMEINNCILINNHFACIGAGLKDNYTVKVVGCDLKSTMSENITTDYRGTIISHNGSHGSTEESRQHLYVKECVITNTNGAYGIQSASAYEGQLADLTLINNVVNVPAGSDGFLMSSNYSLTKKCYGNNIASMNYDEDYVELQEKVADLDETAVRTGSYDGTVAVGLADNLRGDSVVDAEFYKRKTGGTQSVGSGIAAIKEVRGKSIVWNQLVDKSNIPDSNSSKGITWTKNDDASFTIDGTSTDRSLFGYFTGVNITPNHKYFLLCAENIYVHTPGWTFRGNAKDKEIITCGSNTSDLSLFVEIRSAGLSFNQQKVYPQLIDLTLMFGAGNEPATVEEFEAMFPLDYYDYNAGEVIPFAGQNLVTTGKNQYNPTSGKANLLGGKTYQLLGTYTSATIDEVAVTLDSNNCFTTTKDCVLDVTGGNDTDTFVGLYNGETNTFEPYEKHTLPLDPSQWRDKQGNLVFPYGGMHGVGTAYDYAKVDADGYIRKAVRCFGQVDLGSPDYTLNGSRFESQGGVNGTQSLYNKPNFICPKYMIVKTVLNTIDKAVGGYFPPRIAIFDSAYTDATELKKSLQGVPLYYELAEPVEVELATPIYAKYLVDKDGTEEITPANGTAPYTAPANLSILYAMDARGEIKNLPKNYLSKESAENMLNAMKSAGVISNYTMTYSNGKYVFTFTKPSA